MDTFNFITEDDRRDLAYGACIGGTTLTAMAVGRIGGLYGLLGGAAVGVAIGLLTCPFLKEPIKQKLFSDDEPLSDEELVATLEAVHLQTGGETKSDAI